MAVTDPAAKTAAGSHIDSDMAEEKAEDCAGVRAVRCEAIDGSMPCADKRAFINVFIRAAPKAEPTWRIVL